MVDFKIITKGQTHGKAVLVERNIKLAEITSEEFAEMLYTDLMESEEYYKNMANPVLEAAYIEKVKKNRIKGLENAIYFANKKWKTEKRRNQHIEEYKAKMEKPITIPSWVGSSLRHFDFHNSPWSMGPAACFYLETVTKEEIAEAHARSFWSEWFKNAIGYRLTYEAYLPDGSYTSSGRPSIELIFDEEWTAKWEAGEKGLTDAVSSFYKNTTYFGD